MLFNNAYLKNEHSNPLFCCCLFGVHCLIFTLLYGKLKKTVCGNIMGAKPCMKDVDAGNAGLVSSLPSPIVSNMRDLTRPSSPRSYEIIEASRRFYRAKISLCAVSFL